MPTNALVANEPAIASQTDTRAGKYLTFQLANEEFGIRVLKVREIMGLQEITAVPQTPGHIKGVINLRGKVVPVVDLRLKFGLDAAEYTQRTCIIVTQVQGESGLILMGIVVDGVSEVLNLTGPEIEDTPDFGEAGVPSAGGCVSVSVLGGTDGPRVPGVFELATGFSVGQSA